MILTKREVQTILEYMDKFKTTYANIEQTGESGIGSITTAKYPIDLHGVEGDFVVTITDESDW